MGKGSSRWLTNSSAPWGGLHRRAGVIRGLGDGAPDPLPIWTPCRESHPPGLSLAGPGLDSSGAALPPLSPLFSSGRYL